MLGCPSVQQHHQRRVQATTDQWLFVLARDVAQPFGQSMTRRSRVYKAPEKETFIHLQTSQKGAPEQHSGGGVAGALARRNIDAATGAQV